MHVHVRTHTHGHIHTRTPTHRRAHTHKETHTSTQTHTLVVVGWGQEVLDLEGYKNWGVGHGVSKWLLRSACSRLAMQTLERNLRDKLHRGLDLGLRAGAV